MQQPKSLSLPERKKLFPHIPPKTIIRYEIMAVYPINQNTASNFGHI
jgi:hypothetical protein